MPPLDLRLRREAEQISLDLVQGTRSCKRDVHARVGPRGHVLPLRMAGRGPLKDRQEGRDRPRWA